MAQKINQLVSQETEFRVRQQEIAKQKEAEERNKKNFNFVQIEKQALRHIRELYQNARKASPFMGGMDSVDAVGVPVV